ncbi:ATP-dependent metallopeptidase FtsH/Yme1/Tma family protein [Pseudaminobacter sp. NGMCC 1.201702]|uniref:ATP-dependent Zn protease n=1 Tax=Pseudaminobacter sp. NGMCC 1.201702 TaxID=3391825 RepID=UPI0039F032BF
MAMIEQGCQDGAAGDAVLRTLALKARGMSGADVERLVREARQKARRERRQLVFSDVFDILASARPERTQALRWCMAVHEAGHAVARLVLDLGHITSIGIDGPAGGYTEGKTATTGAETEAVFDGLLAVSLAGRAAEEELLGCVSAGAGGSPDSDMGKATTLALAMETELGFAGTWPLLYRHADNQSALLAYNPLLAEQVNARLETAYARARDLIRRNEDAVRLLADAMMQHDALEGTALVAVLREVKAQMASEESHQ